MTGQTLHDWPEMARAAGFIRGYSVLGLRVLYRVISDRRMINRLTRRDGSYSAGTQAKNAGIAERRIADLEFALKMCKKALEESRDPVEKMQLRKKICNIQKDIRRKKFYIAYRRTDKYQDYHRKYMRKLRSKQKAEKLKGKGKRK